MATAFHHLPGGLAADLAQLEGDPRSSFGADIDAAELVLLGTSDRDEKRRILMEWLAHNSPCLFARVGARERHGVKLHICWLETADLDRGESHVMRLIQKERRDWKDEAAEGRSSAFLLMFNDERLAHARPDAAFVRLLQRLAGCYLVERAPLGVDLIYTEAVPLHDGPAWSVFRAGVNFFYPAAHETMNHDRRVAGGVLISVNSPGHLAHSQVRRQVEPSFDQATRESLRLAKLSVGNGGIGSSRVKTCSWHNKVLNAAGRLVPSDRDYSAVYHTDVLIPTMATLGAQANDGRTWDDLRFDYISTDRLAEGHVNYGLFRGHPISELEKYDNPWPPRRPDTLEDLA